MVADLMSSKFIMFLTSSLLLLRQAKSFGPALQRPSNNIVSRLSSRTFTSTLSPLFAISAEDEVFLALALEHAGNGFARTFPNPAVGCVLVRQDTNEVIGSGFHPRAGYPHAEVFALLEAAGHVPSGVQAAKAVVDQDESSLDSIRSLADKYSSEGGPKELFGDCLESFPVTAYVTLEPCCHTGKTPPCANALALAKVDRVVVGFRDPNPRVDGGGVKLLEEAGITVDMAEGMASQSCADMVDSFVKRIEPKDYETDYAWVTGAMRRALRRMAGKLKAEDALAEHPWTGQVSASSEAEVDELELEGKWLERVDFLLWQKELVNLRLNKAVGKKKMAKRLGERIASELGAHVAQTVGHTSLLYRPGIPPFLDLNDLVEEGRKEEEAVDVEVTEDGK
jgi:pyrimidine deaminase RibD-like protein/RNA-binding protein YhbY